MMPAPASPQTYFNETVQKLLLAKIEIRMLWRRRRQPRLSRRFRLCLPLMASDFRRADTDSVGEAREYAQHAYHKATWSVRSSWRISMGIE